MEWVDWVGVQEYKATTTWKNGEIVNATVKLTCNYDGVGQETGMAYTLKANEIQNFPNQSFSNQTFIWLGMTLIKCPEINLTSVSHDHWTVVWNGGNIITSVDRQSVSCNN